MNRTERLISLVNGLLSTGHYTYAKGEDGCGLDEQLIRRDAGPDWKEGGEKARYLIAAVEDALMLLYVIEREGGE